MMYMRNTKRIRCALKNISSKFFIDIIMVRHIFIHGSCINYIVISSLLWSDKLLFKLLDQWFSNFFVQWTLFTIGQNAVCPLSKMVQLKRFIPNNMHIILKITILFHISKYTSCIFIDLFYKFNNNIKCWWIFKPK